MNEEYLEFIKKIKQDSTFDCPVCGSSLYITDYGNHEVTFHCSSPDARFWDFDRGSSEQMKSKLHWDRSRQEVFLKMEDALKYVLKNESAAPGIFRTDDPDSNE